MDHMGPRNVNKPKAAPKCVRHEPAGPYMRDKDSEPADLLNVRDYPICSTCTFCSARIVTYGLFGRAAEWYAEDQRPELPTPGVFRNGGWSISGP